MKYSAFVSLSAAAACLVFLGPNLAYARSTVAASPSSQSMAAPLAGHHEAMQMVATRADLMRALDSSDLHAGQAFQARLGKKTRLKNGTTLPRGTMLVGKVVSDKMNADGTSTLALRFTQADLKHGKSIPIKATIVGIYPPENESALAYGGGPMPNDWTPTTLEVDQIGALKNVDLHSKIASSASGIFVSHKNHNMKLNEGTEFALAIAARKNG
jgi:hypothetical protein